MVGYFLLGAPRAQHLFQFFRWHVNAFRISHLGCTDGGDHTVKSIIPNIAFFTFYKYYIKNPTISQIFRGFEILPSYKKKTRRILHKERRIV